MQWWGHKVHARVLASHLVRGSAYPISHAHCRPPGRTLVLIVHSATDEEYTDNLRFLIKHGMGGQDEFLREFIIIVQQACPLVLPMSCLILQH